MTVTEAGWVDSGSFRPNPGQFPIRVERHLNSFVADHLPGVTTVTNATRYYALHGRVARTSCRNWALWSGPPCASSPSAARRP